MSAEPILPRKWSLRAHGQRNVFSKGANESARHVIMKAVLWALYLPTYPTLTVEVRIGDKYKPDLVAFAPEASIYTAEKPLFWGESGMVGIEKIRSVARRYPDTHLAFAKWATALRPHLLVIQKALADIQRSAPVDLIACPADSVTRFVDTDGNIAVTHADLDWLRLT